ncbi:MAG: RHS repeat-associated core domain-containing protein, partial [Bacteroidota bacterium]
QIQHTSGTFSDIVFNGYEEWTFQGSVEVLPGAYEISVVPYSSLSALPGNLEAVSLELNYPGAVPDPEEKPGAGARISKIENFDIDNQVTHTRLFEYELEGEATGKLYAPPTYVHFIRGLGTTGPGVNTMVDFYYRDYAIRSSNSYISLNNGYTGAYVGYSAVKTTIGYDAEGGYTIKKFHNNGTYRDPKKYVRENIPFFVNQLDGMLHQQEDYNQQADLVRTIENMYTNEPSATDFNWNYIWGNFEYITNSPDFGYHAVPLTIAYADAPQWVKLDKTTEIYYGQTSGDVTTINEYTYEPDHFNMIEHTITNGTDITQTTTFEYAKELATDDPSYELMASDAIHMTGIPLRIKPPNGTEYQTFYNTTYFEPEAFTEKYRDDSQITRSEVLAFDAIGYPERVQNYGFAHPEILEWELGLLKSRTYLDFVDAYDYEMRQVASITAVDKQVVYYDYDRHRRLAGIRARDNKVNTTITYSIGGPNEVEQIITFDDDDLLVQPKSSLKKYDGLGRLTHEYNNGRLENHILYDQIGRIGSETFLTGNYVGYAYDNSPLNQLTLQILPDGNTIATQYEAEDNLYKQLVTDEEDRVTSLFYDILQRQVQVIDAIGGSTEWQFNGYNNLESITTPMGALHEYDYDDRNRMISKAIPGGGTTTYGYYNNSDLLHFQTDGNGIRQSYEYDDYQRLRFNYRGFINDGDVLVEHKYYNEGESDHIDKIEYSRYRVLDGGDEYTTDAYAYDEYGRPYLSTFQHLLGQNLVINNFDLADRLRQASTLHQGHESHSTIQNYEYDSFDRTTRINHEFDDLFSAQVAAYSYNDRDQMIGKVFGNEQGEGLYGLGYQYDNDRGWLRQINKSFNDAAPIPTCLDYEPPQIDDEPDSDDFYYQQMTLTEYLDQRLDVSFQFNPEDDHCPTLECPVPTCTAAEIQQELQTLEATIRRETSYEQAVPCEDGSTEIITIIDFPEHNFPTVLYRVRLCDNSERYILEAYLDLLPTSYEIVQEIPIAGPNQRITTTVGGETLTPTVTEILALIIAGEDIILADYVPCGQPDCNYELECPYEELLAQMAILDLIQQNTPEVVPSPEDYSITVYEVQLCNGEIIYLLEEELELLEGTNILVLGTIEFELAEDRIPVISDVPGGGYRNYPSGVFHMRFSYTPSGNIEWYNLAVYNRARTRQSFSYDDLNRLTSSTYADFTEDGNSLTTDNKYGVPSISYDGDGNITNLVRRGLSYWCEDEVPYYDVIDALSYTYDGLPNQLTSLTEAADKTKGFKTGSNTAGYGYDGVGNMTYDGHRGLAINYNVLNLPQEIATGPDGDYTIIYDASGHKLRQVFENSDNIDITLDYVSGLEYRNGNLEAVNHEEGRIYFPRSLTDEPAASAFREYFIQDHLGNTRLVIGDRNGNNALDLGQDPETDEIIQENNYYPFGMAMEGQWIEHGGEQVRYQYNSKELIEDIGLLDYGARWYDPGIGRWNAVDPMAEKMVEWSPYNYTFGNPIAFNDPSGMIPYRVGNGKPAHLDFTPDEEWLSNGIIANGGNNGGGDKPEKVDYDPGTGEYVVTASRLDIGDTRKVKAPDPGRINYSTGIWGDSKTEAYIGAGEWMTIKPFRSTQSAEIASIIMPTGGGAIKGSKFLKWIFSRRKIFRRTGPILNPVNTGKRAGSAAYKSLNAGDSQHFFSNIVDNYASYAAKFPLRSGDGVARNLYQIRGSLRGKDGIFEWIVEGSKVTHRRFIPKGSINGIPNQIVR